MTMLVVTREGDRRCKLRPSQRAMAARDVERAQELFRASYAAA
ncbi:hypothetical protein ACIBUR_08530 [Streptomyces anulatus]